jgi:hypothetical protein
VRGRPVHHREGTRGNETTVNLLGNAISQAPVPNLPLRFAVEDIDIGGVTLRAGEAILACYGAAGRDPLVYGRGAGQFDVTRAAKEHLAFGYGVHHASARHWPGWKPRSRSRRSSSVIRICPWPSTPAS